MTSAYWIAARCPAESQFCRFSAGKRTGGWKRWFSEEYAVEGGIWQPTSSCILPPTDNPSALEIASDNIQGTWNVMTLRQSIGFRVVLLVPTGL
jgi:hypothetical protein